MGHIIDFNNIKIMFYLGKKEVEVDFRDNNYYHYYQQKKYFPFLKSIQNKNCYLCPLLFNMSTPPPIPKTHHVSEAPQSHPREPLRIYGIIRKNERRKRCETPNRVRIIRKKE